MEDNDTTKEILLEKYPKPITIEGTTTILNQMKYSICKIYTNNGGNGSGFFCNIKYNNKSIKVLITNHHVIDYDYIKINKMINITLNDDKEMKMLKIDDNRKIYSNEMYDTTIIEIKNTDNLNYNYLELDEKLFEENSKIFYEGKSIYNISYPNGDKSSVSYGILKSITDFDLTHLCCTEKGSSGSPIFNLKNNKIIGIHKEGSKNYKFNKGTFLKYPIIDFYNNNKIENNDILYNNIKKDNCKENKIDICKKENNCSNNIYDFIIKGMKIGFSQKIKTNFFANFLFGEKLIHSSIYFELESPQKNETGILIMYGAYEFINDKTKISNFSLKNNKIYFPYGKKGGLNFGEIEELKFNKNYCDKGKINLIIKIEYIKMTLMQFIENIKKRNGPWDASSFNFINHNSHDFVKEAIKIMDPGVSKESVNSKEIYIPSIIKEELKNYII